MEMVDIGTCDVSAFEAVDYKSCKNSLFHRHAFVGEDKFNCSNNEIVEIDLLMENLEISDEDDLNDLLLEECENLLVKKTICSSISNNKTSEFSTELKDLSKCAAVLCSKALQSCPSTIVLGNESSVAVSNPPEDSLVHYHDSAKIMSALKGSRVRCGKAPNPNVHVKWAADVYDPPVTSSSHTVRKHRCHLPKTKPSDHHKRKHLKANKPSNASCADRKHSHRRASSSSSILDARMARMQASAKRSLQTGYGLSKIQASGQDSLKCGSSIHSESPWPLPHPIAEAS